MPTTPNRGRRLRRDRRVPNFEIDMDADVEAIHLLAYNVSIHYMDRQASDKPLMKLARCGGRQRLTNIVLAMMVAVEMERRQEKSRQAVVIRHVVAISSRKSSGTNKYAWL